MDIFCNNDDTVDRSGFNSLAQQSDFLFDLRLVDCLADGDFFVLAGMFDADIALEVEDGLMLHFCFALISFNFLPGFGLGGSTHSLEVVTVTRSVCDEFISSSE